MMRYVQRECFEHLVLPVRLFAARKPQVNIMICRLLGLSVILLIASTIAGYAGPCSPEIAAIQVRLDAKLKAAAAAGPTAPESSSALRHHQPTPGSIAAVERRLGEWRL
jgi:hypothetical protein